MVVRNANRGEESANIHVFGVGRKEQLLSK